MPCFANGFPIGSIPLEHFRFTDTTTNGQLESIAISWVATKHVRMEQMVAHLESVPAISQPIILSKLSVTDSKIDTILRSIDPSSIVAGGEALTDVVCVIPFYWAVGDTVQILYDNPNLLSTGVEIMLVEVE